MPHKYDAMHPEPERTDYDEHGSAPDLPASVWADYGGRPSMSKHASAGAFANAVLGSANRMASVIALLRRRYPAIAEEVERDA